MNDKDKRIGQLIHEAARQSSRGTRRTPLEVTIDRIGDHLFEFGGVLDGRERDALSEAMRILERLNGELQ